MFGVAIITEACIDVKDHARIDVCPVQRIDESDAGTSHLLSKGETLVVGNASGVVVAVLPVTGSADLFGQPPHGR
jgi:hypothetical protein